MSRSSVEPMHFPTIRVHSNIGSTRGSNGVVPVLQLSMYYNDLFIP